MKLFFYIDVYADRELVEDYVLTFELEDASCVELARHGGKSYVRKVKDWERFKESAKEVVLHEMGEELERFKDIEEGLRSAYRYAVKEAKRRGASSVVPAIGFCNPPPEVVEKVFPLPLRWESFPEDLEAFLEKVVREVSEGVAGERWSDEDEVSF